MPKQNFNLDKSFYPQEHMHKVLETFSDYDITYDDTVVMITDEDPQAIFDEFGNYILAFSNERLN
jgi:hypothetical protein